MPNWEKEFEPERTLGHARPHKAGTKPFSTKQIYSEKANPSEVQ